MISSLIDNDSTQPAWMIDPQLVEYCRQAGRAVTQAHVETAAVQTPLARKSLCCMPLDDHLTVSSRPKSGRIVAWERIGMTLQCSTGDLLDGGLQKRCNWRWSR